MSHLLCAPSQKTVNFNFSISTLAILKDFVSTEIRLKMNENQKEYIIENLDNLVTNTTLSAMFYCHLLKTKVLNMNEIDTIDCKPTPSQKAFELYRIIQTKANGYSRLLAALEATNQTGVVAVLTLPERAKRKVEDLRENHVPKRLKESIMDFKFGVKDPTQLFTGRIKELETLHHIFESSPSDLQRITVITQTTLIGGLGGIGKTQLAREYIRRYGAYFDNNVIWMNAEREEELTEGFRRLAKDKLEISTIDANGTEKNIVSIVEDVYRELMKFRSLLVFDNAERTGFLTKFLPSEKGVINLGPWILITSRDMDWDIDCSHVVKVGEMEEDDAVELMKKGLSAGQVREELMHSLVLKLQCFPLAIHQAIAYINEEGKRDDYSIQNYLDEFHSNQSYLLASSITGLQNDYEKTTFTTWRITVAKISEEPKIGASAAHILNCLAYLNADNLSRSMFLGMLPDSDRCERKLKLAVSLLVRYCMVNSENKQSILSVHRLVQQVTRTNLASIGQEEIILRSVLLGIQQNEENGRMFLPYIDHTLSAWSYACLHPELVTEFYMLPQGIVFELGRGDLGGSNSEALKFGTGEMGAKLLERIFPRAHLGRRWLEYQICWALSNREEYSLSLERITALIAEYEPSMEFNFLLSCLRLQATLQNNLGDHEKGVELLLKLFELRNTEGMALKDKETLGRCIHDVGAIYHELRKYDKALEYYKKTSEYFKSLFGPSYKQLCRVEHEIALVTAETGDYVEALKILEEVEKETSELSLKLAICHNIIYYNILMENYESALRDCDSILPGLNYRQERYPITLFVQKLKGVLLLCMDPQHNEALNIILKVYESLRKLFGKYNYYTLDAACTLALAMYCKDRSEETLYTIEDNIRTLESKCDKGKRRNTFGMRIFFVMILEKIGNYRKCLTVLKDLRMRLLERVASCHALLSIIDKMEGRIKAMVTVDKELNENS